MATPGPDEAIYHTLLIASSSLDTAVTSPPSVRSAPERVGRKRKSFEELIREMEEREAE